MTDPATLNRLIAPAIALASDYARRRGTLSASEKSPGQFASDADTEVEALVRRTLEAEFGDVPVIGEEQGGALSETLSGWVIDPIDGTSNFLRGLPVWGISIGLLENGRSVAGAIALPELDLVLTAVRGGGAQVNGAPIARSPAAGGRMIALGENDFEAGTETDSRAQALRAAGYAVVRYRCAVFSLASAALGRLDGYVEYGCRIWDIAAAEILCREAGLDVTVEALGGGRYAIDARWPD